MDNSMISLCMIVPGQLDRKWLFRIADLSNHQLLPFERLPYADASMEGKNNDSLFLRQEYQGYPLYSMQLFEWSPYLDEYDGKWKQDAHPSEESWIEVIKGFESCKQIISLLKNGYDLTFDYERSHNLLFACKGKRILEAVLVTPNDLQVSGKRIWLNEKCNKLPIVSIYDYWIYPCKNRYSPNSPRFYLSTMAVEKTELIQVRPVNETIKILLSSRVKSLLDLSRSDRQVLQHALKVLPNTSFINDIATSLECTETEAKTFLDQFLSSTSQQIDADSYDVRMVEFVVEHNARLAQELQARIEEKWQKDHQSQIQAANQMIESIRSNAQVQQKQLAEQLEKTKNQIEAEQKHLDELRQELKKVDDTLIEHTIEIEETKKLKQEIEEQIKQRLAKLHTEKAACMVEEAFLNPPTALTINSEKTISSHLFFEETSEGKIQVAGSSNEVIYTLSDALQDICVSQTNEYLAHLLIAAASANQSLLIAGPSASIIADLFSCAISGQPCAHIQLGNASDIQGIVSEIQSSKAVVICMDDALEPGKYDLCRAVMDSLPNKKIVITARHRESLYMEPESLFAEFFPVLTEWFIQSLDRPQPYFMNGLEYLSFSFGKEEKRKARNDVRKWFSGEYLSPLLQESVTKLLANILKSATPNIYQRLSIEFVCLPLLLCLRKTSRIKEMLHDSATLNQEEIDRILLFAGEKHE